jgi:uncharacterized RDD family membrane protein YckC
MDCAPGGNPAPEQHFGDAALGNPEAAAEEDSYLSGDAEAWRREVAVRLERYRARRKPRAPRYPSLFLPFDSTESKTRPLHVNDSPGTSPPVQTHVSVALQIEEEPPAAPDVIDFAPPVPDTFEAAKVIEFPRSAAIPVFRAPELAEPLLDRPRIVEAPEILPPPPALGGILIEPEAARESDRKSRPDVPVSPATIPQRLAAALVDGLILGAALAAFAGIFLRLNPGRDPLPLLVGTFLAVAVVLWSAYEFLFVVYTGSTPGLRALKLRLVRFDGSPVSRRSRRWRVLASFLSAFSLSLGYLWSVLDEDGLCWHDRITRTHIQAPDPLR